MNEKEIEAGNRLIAEFIKLQHLPSNDIDEDTIVAPSLRVGIGAENLKLEYHTSFDWLMPVVEKIEGLGYTVHIEGSYCKIGDMNAVISDADKIEVTWLAVVEFIQWHNANK